MAMNRVKVNSDVELKDRLVAINRVTKVTKGGRTFTFAAIVVVGCYRLGPRQSRRSNSRYPEGYRLCQEESCKSSRAQWYNTS